MSRALVEGPRRESAPDALDRRARMEPGRLEIQLRDRVIELGEGEFLIVPRGVEHRPVAAEEAHVLLFEPLSTLNTGNVRGERTVESPQHL